MGVKLIESSAQIEVIHGEFTTIYHDEEETLTSDNSESISEEITLTVAQKQDLVAAQASQLQITLSETEIVEVSQTLKNQIESRSDFIAEIRSAIRSFIDTKANSQKQEINNFV